MNRLDQGHFDGHDHPEPSVEEVFGGAHLANPSAGWLDVAERIRQWCPLPFHDLGDFVANVVRYAGWLSEQAVSYFIIIAGIGLTLQHSSRATGLPTYRFCVVASSAFFQCGL